MKLPVADCVFFFLLLLPLPFPIVKEILLKKLLLRVLGGSEKKMVTFVLHYIVNATQLTWTTF